MATLEDLQKVNKGKDRPLPDSGTVISHIDFGPMGKPLDNEIDVEGPSVIYLPEKNCYFNGFQTTETVKGFMLDTNQAIIFRGTEAGMNARNAVYEILRNQNQSPLIVELIIP